MQHICNINLFKMNKKLLQRTNKTVWDCKKSKKLLFQTLNNIKKEIIKYLKFWFN